MQLSKIELLSASLGILALVITGTGYLMVLNNEVNDLKGEKAAREKELKEFKKGITNSINKELSEIRKEKNELQDIKEKLQSKYINRNTFIISNTLDAGISDFKNKKYNSSIEKFNAVLDKEPSNRVALLYMIKSYTHEKNYNSALAYLEKALALGHEDYDIFYSGGQIFEHDEDHDKALYYYNKALEFDKNNINLHMSLHYNYLKINKNKKALYHINYYINLSRNHPYGYFMRAQFYEKNNEPKKAKSDYAQAVKLADNAGYNFPYIKESREKVKSLP